MSMYPLRFGARQTYPRVLAATLAWLVCGAATLAQTPTEQAAIARLPGAPESASPVDPDNYIIGPGDSLSVFVWRQPELSITVPVRPDGHISTPLVEDIEAVGKTPTRLARDIEGVLAEYIRMPQVTIIVQSFVGAIETQIRVLGQVTRPGPMPYREGMTLVDVLLEAGGLTQFAAGNRGKLVRTENGVPVEQRVRLERLLEKGDLTENLPVRPGDVVIVPAAVF